MQHTISTTSSINSAITLLVQLKESSTHKSGKTHAGNFLKLETLTF